MKKILVMISFSFLFIPFIAGAHGMMMDFDDVSGGSQMMRFIEDQVLGTDIHEEMEELTAKMMRGMMTEEEAGRMVAFIQQYPGAGGMMMDRMMNTDFNGKEQLGGFGMMRGDHMTGGGGIVWVWILMLSVLVWLVVGVFAAVWLWKHISKK